MKFIASTTTLLKQLLIINGVISSKVVIPILEYFLFEIENGKLRIVGTDLEVSMQGTIPVESKENGKIAVPASKIIEILKSLPEQPITFTINEKNNSIELSSENGKYKISGEVAEDFPKFPTIEDAKVFELPAEILESAISKTIHGIGTDELKPALTGLFIELDDEKIKFVSTDGNKLVQYTRTDITLDDTVSIILPKKALNVLKTSITTDDEKVTVEFNNVNALFSLGNQKIVCRLIDEKFPDYNSAIPIDLPNILRIDKYNLIDALKRTQIFADKSTYEVIFKITGNDLQLESQDIDYSNEANERLTCEYDGINIEIGFSARFLIEMVSNIDSQEVVLSLSSKKRPGTITPAEPNENEELLMLLMPIVVKESDEDEDDDKQENNEE
ncbi:MAG: DNA polymerase III subunit beta [Bacteroidota bacterium]|nr:DNA polymerase III subunit beta [Bacteroidota bacterium]